MPQIYYSQYFDTFMVLPVDGNGFVYSKTGYILATVACVKQKFIKDHYLPIFFNDCPENIKTCISRDFPEFNEELEDGPWANYKIS
jgi:hypothetical protein